MTKIRDIFNKSLKNYADTRELDYKKAVYDSLGKEIDVADLDDLFEQATEALEEMTRVGTYIVEIPNYEELITDPRFLKINSVDEMIEYLTQYIKGWDSIRGKDSEIVGWKDMYNGEKWCLECFKDVDNTWNDDYVAEYFVEIEVPFEPFVCVQCGKTISMRNGQIIKDSKKSYGNSIKKRGKDYRKNPGLANLPDVYPWGYDSIRKKSKDIVYSLSERRELINNLKKEYINKTNRPTHFQNQPTEEFKKWLENLGWGRLVRNGSFDSIKKKGKDNYALNSIKIYINHLIDEIISSSNIDRNNLSYRIETTRNGVLFSYDGVLYDYFSWNGQQIGNYRYQLDNYVKKFGYDIEDQDANSVFIYK